MLFFSNFLWYDEGIMLAFQRHCKGREEQEIWEKMAMVF
jgi:hypothetical protein